MSRRSTTLESRLVDWAREYGGRHYDDIGWSGVSPMAQIMKYHGRAPQGLNPRRIETNSPGDQVERAVRVLEGQERGRIPACIIRCEYFASASAKDEKLGRLKRIGVDVKEVGYSQHLRIAKVHVAAWIHVPFDEPVEEEDRLSLAEIMLGT